MLDDTEGSAQSHPLDGTDPEQCYQIMMNERSTLITARRESEDNLIKNIISLSSAMIVLMAGLTTQIKIDLSISLIILYCCSMTMSLVSIISGMTENYFSSKAYLKQQEIVEKFYSKAISYFDEPAENKYVRRSQVIAFGAFLSSLFLIGAFSINVLIGSLHVQKPATASAATTPASASSASPPASAREVTTDTVRLQDEVSGTVNATATTKEVIDAGHRGK